MSGINVRLLEKHVQIEVDDSSASLTFPQAYDLAEAIIAEIDKVNGPRGMSRWCPRCGAAGVRTTLMGIHRALPDTNRCTCPSCHFEWRRCDEERIREEQRKLSP